MEYAKKRIGIVGGGIVGLSVAWQLSRELSSDQFSITVFEKEKELAFHQTGHNSGVLHSGIYYAPGSLRAKNCHSGRTAMVEFCREHKLPHDVCGKIIVASKKSELPFLQKIFDNGKSNGTEDIRWINDREIQDIEPHCRGIKGIWVGSSGIADYRAVGRKMAELFQANRGEIIYPCLVEDFKKTESGKMIKTSRGDFFCDYLIACGGSQSDRLARADGLDPEMRIVSFRGEYYDLLNHEKVRNLIYPVPNPAFPFLGVHFTRMTDGRIECGPNAVFAFKRDGYGKFDFNLRDSFDAITYSGFIKLVSRNVKFGIVEQWRSISKQAFLKNLQVLIPSLKSEDIQAGRSGVRALALASDGNIFDDFKFVTKDNSLHVLNAPSPAATASIAIGQQICQKAIRDFRLQ